LSRWICYSSIFSPKKKKNVCKKIKVILGIHCKFILKIKFEQFDFNIKSHVDYSKWFGSQVTGKLKKNSKITSTCAMNH
jgi:hypothetical protein